MDCMGSNSPYKWFILFASEYSWIGQENRVDVGEDTAVRDGDASQQLAEFNVVADHQEQVACGRCRFTMSIRSHVEDRTSDNRDSEVAQWRSCASNRSQICCNSLDCVSIVFECASKAAVRLASGVPTINL
jgi:hypothetical protein